MKKRKRKFSHLDAYRRDRLEALLTRGCSQKEIAEVLEVDKSTISREIRKRKTKGIYNSGKAQAKANVKRSSSKYQGMKISKHPELKDEIVAGLKESRSPDEIAGRMKKEKQSPRIGTNAIYKWLYSSLGERYTKYLCTKRKRRKKQKRKPSREMIPDRISIHNKPKRKKSIEIEGDTFVSPKRSGTTESVFIGSVRETHLLVGTKLPNLKPKTMEEGCSRSFESVSADLMILDNGIENKNHKSFPLDTYFCDPHSPWQKPHVEGDIGLLRRWFIPKGTDLRNVSEKQLQSNFHTLNSKYRKSLGYASAYEISLKKGIINEIPKI